MSIRLSNKYIPTLEISSPIEDDRRIAQSILSLYAESVRPKPLIYDGWKVAGSDEPTDEDCGKFIYLGCLNRHVESTTLLIDKNNEVIEKFKKNKYYNLLNLDKNLKKRSAYIRPFKRNCDKLRCSTCGFKTGVKRSFKIEKRLNLYSKLFGNNYPSHVIVSPLADTSLDYLTMRKLANKRLKTLGFRAWVLITHPFRNCNDYKTVSNDGLLDTNDGVVSDDKLSRTDMDKSNQEHVSIEHPTVSSRGYNKLGFHFHAVGFGWIDGKKQAKLFHDEKEEKMIVKKLPNVKRNIRKTVIYLLSHCGVHKKYHSITYNGKLSYSERSLSSDKWIRCLDGKLYKVGSHDIPEEEQNNINECPICHEKLRVLDYVGIDRPPIMNEPYYDKSDKWKYIVKREPFKNSSLWIAHLSKNYDTPRIARKRRRL